jgi:hypothetical protein
MQVLPRAAMLFKQHPICRDGNSRYYESKSDCTLLVLAEALTGKPFRATETEYVPCREETIVYYTYFTGSVKKSSRMPRSEEQATTFSSSGQPLWYVKKETTYYEKMEASNQHGQHRTEWEKI